MGNCPCPKRSDAERVEVQEQRKNLFQRTKENAAVIAMKLISQITQKASQVFMKLSMLGSIKLLDHFKTMSSTVHTFQVMKASLKVADLTDDIVGAMTPKMMKNIKEIQSYYLSNADDIANLAKNGIKSTSRLGSVFKMVSKTLPFVAAGISLYSARQCFKKGQKLNCALQVVNGVAVFTYWPVSLGVSAAVLAKNIYDIHQQKKDE